MTTNRVRDQVTSAAASAMAAMRGFSIMEIMVAMTIALIIMAGVSSIYLASRSSYRVDEGLARLQENARFAIDFLQREIRMAAYLGCLRDTGKIKNDLNTPGDLRYNLAVPIQGFEAANTGPNDTVTLTAADLTTPSSTATDWGPALDAALLGQVLPNTDVVVVRYVSSATVRSASDAGGLYVTNAAVFTADVAAALEFQAGDIAVISNCNWASVFQISANDPGSGGGKTWRVLKHDNLVTLPGNATPTWPTAEVNYYSDGGEVGKLITTAYFIGRNAAGTGPALFRGIVRAGANPTLLTEELVEGVENMQILYGLDLTPPVDGVAEQYVTANSVADWSQVVSVRIGLLMRTSDNLENTDTNTYMLGGGATAAATTINPVDDRRRRRIFTTTIQLRNRLTVSSGV